MRRALNVPSGDLRKWVLLDERLSAAAVEAIELKLDVAESNLTEALSSEDPRRRDAVSMFFLRHVGRAAKRGYAIAALGVEANAEPARPVHYTIRWANETQCEEIERDVFLRSADLLRLDVDLIFYDTTTAYFEIDEPDEYIEQWAGRLFPPLRQRGHSKEGRDANPQVIIALAVTRDGMPVRSWVLPGNTADVATVARIKQDLHAWRLGRCLFVGDAGMYSADNLVELSRGLGRYVLAVPMRRVQDVEAEVLTRPGRRSRKSGSATVSGANAMSCASILRKPSASASIERRCWPSSMPN